MSAGGKGHDPRPFSVDEKTFADNYEKTFGKKKERAQWVPPPLPRVDPRQLSLDLGIESDPRQDGLPAQA